MPPLLRLVIPTIQAIPGFYGGCDIAGGWIAMNMESILRRMTDRKNRLAEQPFPADLANEVERLLVRRRARLADPSRLQFGRTFDPVVYAAERLEDKELRRLEDELSRYKEYLALKEAVLPVEAAFERAEDLDVEARLVLFVDVRSQIEKHCRPVIHYREFEFAECRACAREYLPAECRESNWSAISDARAGVGGSHLACPVGHVIFPIKTWVA